MTGFVRVITGLWIGTLERPYEGEFDAVLALGGDSAPTDDGVRHFRIALPADDEQAHSTLDQVVTWVVPRWMGGQRLLLQSPTALWAGLGVAATCIHLGAAPDEAIQALLAARPLPIPEHLRALLNREGRRHGRSAGDR